jgi:hypothetical protein
MSKTYRNGSTSESIFCDTNLTKKIGALSPYEICECLGIYENRAVVKYKVSGTNNYKVGFAKYIPKGLQ